MEPIAHAEDLQKTPLPADHPLIGTWQFDIPGKSCREVTRVHADGTADTTSGEEIGKSEFAISLQASDKGFYRWVDKVVTNNGKPDCGGHITPLGDVATVYIFLLPSQRQFLMCYEENSNQCIGPYVRVDEGV